MSKIYKTEDEKREAFSSANVEGDSWNLESRYASGSWRKITSLDLVGNIIRNRSIEIRSFEKPEIKAVDLLGWYTLNEGDCSLITGYRKDGRIETVSICLELEAGLMLSKDGKTNWLKLEDIVL